MLGVVFQPGVGQEIAEVWWPGGAGEAKGKFGEDGIQPDPRFHLAVFRAGDDAQQDDGAVTDRFTSDEQPVVSANRRKLDHAFSEVVIDFQSSVFCIATQSLPLIQRVREGLADRAIGKDIVLFLLQPGFECGQNRDRVRAQIY